MQITLHHRYEDDPRFSIILGKLSDMALSVAQLTTDVAALTAAVASIDTDLGNLRTEIQNLSAQIAAGNPVTQAQIDALDQSVANAVTNLSGQVAQDQESQSGSSASAPSATPNITTDKPAS